MIPPNGLTGSEQVYWETETERGSRLYRAGWPDFMVEGPDGKVIGVEIKSGYDFLSDRQTAMLDVLERAGIECFVWRPEKEGLIPWREDVPPVDLEPEATPEPEAPKRARPKIPFRDLGATIRDGEMRASPYVDDFNFIVERTGLDPRTVRRWVEGEPVRAIIDRMCREAAALAGVKVAEP